jgi:hypothetical protein
VITISGFRSNEIKWMWGTTYEMTKVEIISLQWKLLIVITFNVNKILKSACSLFTQTFNFSSLNKLVASGHTKKDKVCLKLLNKNLCDKNHNKLCLGLLKVFAFL